MKQDKTDYQYHYCRNCKKLFKSIVSRSYYTYNNFIDNQARLTLDVPYNHDMTVSNQQHQCPFCRSIYTVNVNDVLTGKLIIRSEKLARLSDRKMLKSLGEWLKHYGDITGYYIDKNVLYTDGKRLKQQIQRLLWRKKIHLNTMNDKVLYEEKHKSLTILIRCEMRSI